MDDIVAGIPVVAKQNLAELEPLEIGKRFCEFVVQHRLNRGKRGLYEVWQEGGKTKTRTFQYYHFDLRLTAGYVPSFQLFRGPKGYSAVVDGWEGFDEFSGATALCRAAVLATMMRFNTSRPPITSTYKEDNNG